MGLASSIEPGQNICASVPRRDLSAGGSQPSAWPDFLLASCAPALPPEDNVVILPKQQLTPKQSQQPEESGRTHQSIFHAAQTGLPSVRSSRPSPTTVSSSVSLLPVPLLQQPHFVPSQPLRPLAAATLNAPPLLIWDWDDTLMCSSAINNQQLYAHQAQQLECVLEQLLSLSLRLGETLIVTNADQLWVTESARQFTPRVAAFLSRIPIISARVKYEGIYPNDVFAWKRETFREVIGARVARSRPGSLLNLVVLGDSPSEMEAAHSSTLGVGLFSTVKTVKFKENPTADELIEQLHMMTHELGSIVAEERTSFRNLVQRMHNYSGANPLASLTYLAQPTARQMIYHPTPPPVAYTHVGAAHPQPPW